MDIKAPQKHVINEDGIPVKEGALKDFEKRAQFGGTKPPMPHLAQKSPLRQPRPPSGYYTDTGYNKPGLKPRPGQLSYPPRNLQTQMDDTFQRAPGTMQFGPQPFQAPIAPPMKFGLSTTGRSRLNQPQNSWNKQPFEVTSFDYQYDFDENGVFFFLGTEGGTKVWQNPHSVGNVQAFASSLGFGSIQDLVGRKCVNLRTLNENFSFFGVDLGEGRKLLPS
jgi:hypothetical protein